MRLLLLESGLHNNMRKVEIVEHISFLDPLLNLKMLDVGFLVV
jgi:hypothetical protein